MISFYILWSSKLTSTFSPGRSSYSASRQHVLDNPTTPTFPRRGTRANLLPLLPFSLSGLIRTNTAGFTVRDGWILVGMDITHAPGQ